MKLTDSATMGNSLITIEEIREKLLPYQRRIIPDERYPGYARAAVMILLFQKDKELSLLLTVRTNDVETHKGQISCPGGMRDESDSDFAATALRETEEELGIPEKSIEILGMTDDHPTPTKFIITPVVGYTASVPKTVMNTSEVAEVFDVPLSVFIEKKNARSEERLWQGNTYNVWYFDYKGYTIWGATAMLLVNFAEIIGGKKAGGQ